MFNIQPAVFAEKEDGVRGHRIEGGGTWQTKGLFALGNGADFVTLYSYLPSLSPSDAMAIVRYFSGPREISYSRFLLWKLLKGSSVSSSQSKAPHGAGLTEWRRKRKNSNPWLLRQVHWPLKASEQGCYTCLSWSSVALAVKREEIEACFQSNQLKMVQTAKFL